MLPFCSNCGKEVLPGAKFCPECGAPQKEAATPAAAVGARPAQQALPDSTRIVGLSDLAVGVAYLLLGALSAGITGVSIAAQTVALLLFAGAGIVLVLTGYGLMKRRSWARIVGTVAGLGGIVVGYVLVSPLASGLLTGLGIIALVVGLSTLVFVRLERFRKNYT